MKTILYMATSIDGFIAKKNGDSDWVSEADTVNFEKKLERPVASLLGGGLLINTKARFILCQW